MIRASTLKYWQMRNRTSGLGKLSPDRYRLNWVRLIPRSRQSAETESVDFTNARRLAPSVLRNSEGLGRVTLNGFQVKRLSFDHLVTSRTRTHHGRRSVQNTHFGALRAEVMLTSINGDAISRQGQLALTQKFHLPTQTAGCPDAKKINTLGF